MGLSLNLEKGLSLNLTKEFGKFTRLNLGLGWDTRMDLDAFAILLDENNKRIDTVSYSHRNSNGVSLSGDNTTGEGDGDDEVIYVDISSLSKQVKKICLFTNIYSAMGRTFKEVNGSYIRLINPSNDEELARYSLKDSSRNFNAFHFADLIIKDDEILFDVIGQGLDGSISKIEKLFDSNDNQPKKKGWFW